MTNLADANTPVTAFYLSGSDGIVSNPVEPTLPLETENVSAANTVLRGVGFRGGSYTDLPNIIPFSGAPTTEIRGVHAPFLTDVFYPIVPWRVNYFGALADPAAGATRLTVTPAQFLSNAAGAPDGTLRRFDQLDFRLFYSSNVGTFADNSVPALAAPPTIALVTAVPDNGTVHFQMKVVSNPASGVQEVWVTYTAVNGPWAGVWQSLDLSQNTSDTTLWEGALDLNGADPFDVRYMVQAANGVGLVSLATNLGGYYIPGVTATGGEPTDLALAASATAGAYGTQATFTAALSSNGQPAAGQLVSIGLGPQTRLAVTDANGEAAVTLSLLGLPGAYDAKATFAGNADFAASTATTPFTINKQDTAVTLAQPASGFAEDDNLLLATLTDATGRPLGEKTLFFIISGQGGAVSEAVITDYAGRAALGNLALPHGTYTVDVYFGGAVPLHTGETATYGDDRYNPTMTTGSLELLNHAPAAVDDAYMVDEDHTLIVSSANGVLHNDTDGDNDGLTAALITSAAHGAVTLHADGSFTYMPAADFNGIDSFTYAANDGQTDSNAATVTIVVNAVNDAPTAVDDSYNMDQDTILAVSAPGILGNDTDVENDSLTAVLSSGPAHGSLTLGADGSFTYTPEAGFYGLDSFTYRADDGGGLLSNEATVTITVNFVNHPPICTAAYASVDSIWPANKDFYPVNIFGVTDTDGQTFAVTITSIFQDEAVGKKVDGMGVGTDTAVVRAERDGNGDGRVYHIFFSADDGMGGLCSGEVLVPIVPHDQSGDVNAIDGGALYDSTVPD
ncbi:MAG: Ig-like domain-containing protein [Anaerolineae bacterium]